MARTKKLEIEHKIYYQKRGRRYVPVSVEVPEAYSSFPVPGTHLIHCYTNGQIRIYNIDPAYAPMVAAGQVARDAITDAIREASDIRPRRAPITEGQRKAWENLIKEFGEDAHMLEWPSAAEAAGKAIDAMAKEAIKLLNVPAVKNAYEHFLLVCELTKEDNESKS
jgi:hypothetical protein